MARRTLSTTGRLLIAGASVSVAGLLTGLMAASDHTANANQPSTSTGTQSDDNSGISLHDSGAQSFQPQDDGSGSDSGRSFQPHTRTGGS
jgi:hypothetical protein